MSREAMQQALEALEVLDRVMQRSERTNSAITALRQALAEPEQPPEALGYVPLSDDGTHVFIDGIGLVPLAHYAPTPRKPVELTDSEVDDLTMAIRNAYPLIETPFYVWCRHFSRAVIAEYERKNGITGDIRSRT